MCSSNMDYFDVAARQNLRMMDSTVARPVIACGTQLLDDLHVAPQGYMCNVSVRNKREGQHRTSLHLKAQRFLQPEDKIQLAPRLCSDPQPASSSAGGETNWLRPSHAQQSSNSQQCMSSLSDDLLSTSAVQSDVHLVPRSINSNGSIYSVRVILPSSRKVCGLQKAQSSGYGLDQKSDGSSPAVGYLQSSQTAMATTWTSQPATRNGSLTTTLTSGADFTTRQVGATLSWWLSNYAHPGFQLELEECSADASQQVGTDNQPMLQLPTSGEQASGTESRRSMSSVSEQAILSFTTNQSAGLQLPTQPTSCYVTCTAGEEAWEKPDSSPMAGSVPTVRVRNSAPTPPAIRQQPAPMDSRPSPHPIPPELRNVDTSAVLVAKALTKSDATTRRLIVPRIAIEANLPGAVGSGFLPIQAVDHNGVTWEFMVRAWSNGHNPKPVYVLEQISDYMREYSVCEGDVIGVCKSERGFAVELNSLRVRAATVQPLGSAVALQQQARHAAKHGASGKAPFALDLSTFQPCPRTPGCCKPAWHTGWCTGHKGFRKYYGKNKTPNARRQGAAGVPAGDVAI